MKFVYPTFYNVWKLFVILISKEEKSTVLESLLPYIILTNKGIHL